MFEPGTVLVCLILFCCFSGAILPWFLLHLYLTSIRSTNASQRDSTLRALGVSSSGKRLVGFFHPYCNAGGGGERVLWTAIAAIQGNEKDVISVVYSGDIDATKEEIIAKVKSRFDITLDPAKLIFVFLNSRRMVEDSTWPFFTLLGQSIGSMYLAWEAMGKLIPDLYIDTMGYAFTFHVVAWVANVPIGAYVHYPTISTDMLERVKSRKRWHTNSNAISSSSILSAAKLFYYRLFMYYYSLSLRSAVFVMANSTWTKNHVDSILQHSDPLLDFFHLISPPFLVLRYLASQNKKPVSSARIVYPPCDTREMATIPLEGRERVIISVAQFRPEKDHPAQLHALHELFKEHPEFKESRPVKLVMVGGSRNAQDAARVENLRTLSKELGLNNHVELLVNAPYPDMLRQLSKASIGMNTMVDEHFGINVVEYMAAGVIPIVHASAGPLHDIVVPFNGEPTGFHAKTPKDFADGLYKALSLTDEEDLALRLRARTWAVQRFSEEEFEKGWNASGWRSWL
ncbi:asparagine-linked glycosylation alpha-mannosyltransferase-like protein [Moniliophthora roreri MCA 2997]|uniref:GDP-Man:Man(3)GlcNAc(2)-PP-Dol alpha-1,2-mannosyltransferase n=2 Tax=Moniliophthora roreri TaxID=221103 RepID=V2XY25_MONRO|nr:asparagine-linked glycosylation alpha-mannosyltransferase-like protein [Moniliophthora roreri MCA 2997]